MATAVENAAPRPFRSEGVRYHEIDALKADAILVVVLIHSIRSPWNPWVSPAEKWIGEVTRFAVPAFFAASGYLYATTQKIPFATTRRRLKRILVPYLLASLMAQVFWVLHGRTPQIGVISEELLLCSSFGPYYFIMVIVFFVLAAPIFPRLHGRRLPIALLLLLLVQVSIETGLTPPLPIFWRIRNPFLWLGYFVLGWWARMHRDRLMASIGPHRLGLAGGLLALFIALAAATAAPLPHALVAALAWGGILVAIALGFVSAAPAQRLPAVLRWLSDCSYAIYLFHLLFVYPARSRSPLPRGVFDARNVALHWLAGVVGSALLIVLVRRLLGRRSRTLLGA